MKTYECYNSGGGIFLSILHDDNIDYVVSSDFVECISVYDMNIPLEDGCEGYWEENMILSVGIEEEGFSGKLVEIYNELIKMLNNEMEKSRKFWEEYKKGNYEIC